MDFKTILKEQFKDLITEESLQAVHEAFEAAVSEKVDARVNLEVDSAVQKVDEDHTSKLKSLVEAIDADHTAKLHKLVEATDIDHAVKFKKAIKKLQEKYQAEVDAAKEKLMLQEKSFKVDAKNFQEELTEKVSNYIDLYLEKATPKDQITEAVENIRAKKQLDEVRRIIGIDSSFVDMEVKEALQDGADTITSLKNELNEALKQNTILNAQVKANAAKLLIEEKTKDMPTDAMTYVKKMFRGRDAEYITENFPYVVNMFNKSMDDESEDEGVKATHKVLTEAVDRPVIEEANNEISELPSNPGVTGYLNEMKKADGSILRAR